MYILCQDLQASPIEDAPPLNVAILAIPHCTLERNMCVILVKGILEHFSDSLELNFSTRVIHCLKLTNFKCIMLPLHFKTKLANIFLRSNPPVDTCLISYCKNLC